MTTRKITRLLVTFSNVNVDQDESQKFVRSVILTDFPVLYRYQNGPFDYSKLLRHLL